MNFFVKSYESLDDVKKDYRKFARENHPDCGGSEKQMQILNDEYEKVQDIIKRNGKYIFDEYVKTTNKTTYQKETTYSNQTEDLYNFIYENLNNFANEKQNTYTFDKSESFTGTFFKKTYSFYYTEDIKSAFYKYFGKENIVELFIHKGTKEGYVIYVDKLNNRRAAAMKIKVYKKNKSIVVSFFDETCYYMRTTPYINMPIEMLERLDSLEGISSEEKNSSKLWRQRVMDRFYTAPSLKQGISKNVNKLNNGDKIRSLNGFVTLGNQKEKEFIVIKDGKDIKFNVKRKLIEIKSWEKWDIEKIENRWFV